MYSSDPPNISSVYGDLLLVNPGSDISFEDTSNSEENNLRVDETSETLPASFQYPTFFQSETDGVGIENPSRGHPRPPSEAKKSTKIGGDSCLNEVNIPGSSLQRFRSLVSRPRSLIHRHLTDPKIGSAFLLKRNAESLLRGPKQIVRKRFKYHNISNEDHDIEYGSFDFDVSELQPSKQMSFETYPAKFQSTDLSARCAAVVDIDSTGAYDNRPIFNNMFHGNEHDDSFHKERKVLEPLLKPTAIEQLAKLNMEDRNQLTNSPNNSTNGWSQVEKKDRVVTSPFHYTTEGGKNLGLKPLNPIKTASDDVSSDDESSASYFEADEKPLLKQSIFAACGCLPRNRKRHQRRRNKKERSLWTTEKQEGKVVLRNGQRYTRNYDLKHANTIEHHDNSTTKFTFKSTRSLFDEETLQKELHELDILANEIYRSSPELLRMPVDSQLSAITEVDEDLTQRSSSISAHSKADLSQHLRSEAGKYSSLGAMLDNEDTSITTDEPNFFTIEFRSQSSNSAAPERQVKENEHGTATSEKHFKNRETRDPVTREELDRDRNFRLKGGEITMKSLWDEDSTSDISDLTEDFSQIAATSYLFKKAMAKFQEGATDEDGRDIVMVDESRDDVDDLNQIATLQI
ncbi:hypothetical protein IV203_030726 [Nitzschia inconspicua]|uniref:Uncharacterized protein n=1 Tax=Nitzschia inconspicua TaxID=303405 RepID=A0A9K3LU16_9STRA|nr:hypothetical protein IV203_030726 [Nitzschia inconspicua]